MSLPGTDTAARPPMPPPESTPPATPRAAFIAAVVTAVVAAAALSWDRPGIGWPVTALAVIAAVLVAVRSHGRADFGRVRADRIWSGRAMIRTAWAVAAGILFAVGAVRAAGWLFVLCALTAALAGCVALIERRSIDGMSLAPLRVAASVPAGLRWLIRGGIRGGGGNREMLGRTIVAGLIAVALLLVFGVLLASGDAAFARTLSAMVPAWDGGTVFRWIWSAAVAVTVTAAAAHILLIGSSAPSEEIRPRQVRRIEWALTVGGLVALFAVFVAVQASVLFGGREYVETTTGLTYAQYARSGFWQLLAVTGLTVVVIGVVAQIAPRSTTTDRLLLRTLLGLLSALALVIVASALSRMAAYEQAFGFTRQRLLVTACELWLGAVFVLILIAGIRLKGRWVPQAALATAVATLLGLATLNPDDFIARQNIARYNETGRIDLDYLKTLSPDAVPALQTLPEPYRSCALAAVNSQLAASRPETWLEWNLSRSTARARLHDHPPAQHSLLTCPH